MKKIFISILASGLLFLSANEEFIVKNDKYNTNIKVITTKQNGQEVKKVFNNNKEVKTIITSFHKNGKILKIEEKQDNMLNGFVIEYYESGSIKEKTRYLKGEKNGVKSIFKENGHILSEESYINNLLDGYSFYYKGKGVVDKLFYKNGKLSNN